MIGGDVLGGEVRSPNRVNLLNSRLVIKPVVSDILFLISVVFLLRTALVVRVVMPGILLSTDVAFVFRAALLTRLRLSDVLFQYL